MTDQEAALGAPFDSDEIEWKPQAVSGHRALAIAYIDARAVMDRLDGVVGPANWQDVYEVLPDGNVVCELSLRLDGQWVSKSDVGSLSDQSDLGDRRKAAFSDALKRAAVKWGIGRYLYRLPAQWVPYDPQAKQLRETPALPAWALPRQPAKPAAAPAAPLPQTGAELQGRLLLFEDRLRAANLCDEGELLHHIRQWGVGHKLPEDIAQWPPGWIPAAVEEARRFEEARRRERGK